MPMYAGSSYAFWRDDAGDAARPFHFVTQIYDPSWSTGSKVWVFGTGPTGSVAVPMWQMERTPQNNAEYLGK